MELLKELWLNISKKRQKQLYLLILLMILASMLEIVSIGVILPFLGILTNPEYVYQHSLMQYPIQVLELTSPHELILPITILFISAIIVSAVVRIALLYAVTKLSFSTGAELSVKLYRKALCQEYSTHVLQNSSEIINSITSKTNTVINGILNPALVFLSSIIIIIGIMSALMTISLGISVIVFISFGMIYLLLIRYSKEKLKTNSQVIAYQSTRMIKSLQEGLGGIRDVLIDGSQSFYCNLYQDADLPLRKALGSNVFISGSPKYAVEAIGMMIIVFIAFFMTGGNNDEKEVIIPILGALALGAQRLLPVFQQTYAALTTMKGSRESLSDILKMLSRPTYGCNRFDQSSYIMPFESEINIRDLSFRYNKNSNWVLKSLSLTLKKNTRIGFIGLTGSGKSTLLDIIMGLLPPDKGGVYIDGCQLTIHNKKKWQNNVAHVPQHIYLSDGTIEENIAFGVSRNEIDHRLVKKSAEQAKIAEMIDQWKDGYKTLVGERGVRLSGGQRQRIGIARALYKQAKVLILDEATSALDNQTEKMVMNSIENLGTDLTILIIAHRLSTLKDCDMIVRIDSDFKIHTGTYKELINE